MEILSKPNDYDLFIEKGIARAEGRLPMPEQRSEATDEDIVGTTVIPDIRYSPNLSMAFCQRSKRNDLRKGFGHGVGMSQWGAKTMAERGWNFRQILEYYFPGTTIGQ